MILLRIAGWVLMVPCGIVSSIIATVLPFAVILTLIGVFAWSSLGQWLVILVVATIGGAIGYGLTRLGVPDDGMPG